MRILILNWRDPQNPRSGGAEAVTFKYAKFWASRGYSVTWICNAFPKGKPDEAIGGVRFIRVGPALGYTVFQLFITYPLFLVRAIWTAINLIRDQKYDVVIDEIHGLPFFTPLYNRTRTVLWVCEVAGPIWDKMYPFPINIVGNLLEKLLYLIVYRQSEIWAISQSTRSDILKIHPQAQVKVIPLGIDPVIPPRVKKTSFPSAVFLARLVKMKGVEVALAAAQSIVRKLPNFKLYLIGDGSREYVDLLRRLAQRLEITSNVEFLGRLSDSHRNSILAKSHFLIHPSYKEGFGLTVLEAGLVGTPAIVRSGGSLTELVKDGYSGLVFQSNAPLPALFIRWYSSKQYPRLCRRAQANAKEYEWPTRLASSHLVTGLP